MRGTEPTALTYSQFLDDVRADTVQTATIDANGGVSGQLKDGTEYRSQIPIALQDSTVAPLLEQHDVQVTGQGPASATVLSVILSLLPLLLFVGLFIFLGRRAGRQLAGGLGSLTGSRAKLYDAEKPTTRFSDVAGYEGAKQEVAEVVDFLKHPNRYAKVGAIGPKGVLMVGPPGTGKTLMARAVAGEAGVPFFSVTGSSFIEIFVGVGASRVRDLFAEARKRAPAIVFIDEIDAIGARRGGALVSNDEREQTLNQLLAEMDGFDASVGVVVIAATNRPETLDPALLRPGRFDRQVEIPLPNLKERAAILAVHAKGKKLGPDVDLLVVARGTPGFSGADLANLLNEAAIVAVRAHRDTVTAADFDEARDRILLGRRDASNALLPEEKRAVAVHEAGHALVAVLSEHADPGVEGHDPPRRTGSRRDAAASRGRAAPLSRELPAGFPRHPDGWARGREPRYRGGLDRSLQRSGRSHAARHEDGHGVRDEPQARTGRLRGRRSRLPRPTGDPQPPVRGGHAAGDRPGGRASPQGSR